MVIDPAQLKNLQRMGGAKFIRQIIDVFLESTQERISTFQLAKADWVMKDIQFSAHALKSSAGNLGARELQFLCGQLEIFAESGAPDVAEPLVVQLLESYHRTCAALKAERERISS
jgi:two-component system, sensor histidine kinase and response regulator